MSTTYNPYLVDPYDSDIVAYDWQGREIYDYEDYYIFFKNKRVKDDDSDILEYAYEHQKEALLDILFDDYDYSFSKRELSDYIRDLGEFVEHRY